MKNISYDEIADKHKSVDNKRNHILWAFISGGLVGFFGEVLIEVLCRYFSYSRNDASSIMIVFFIFCSSCFTALGFFDKLVEKCRCGLLIPITGFAHSMTSSALDYKKEGPIYGIGSNLFRLAGSVILYGIVSAWFFGMIRYLIGGIG